MPTKKSSQGQGIETTYEFPAVPVVVMTMVQRVLQHLEGLSWE